MDPDIQARFHEQIGRHGHELISFVAEDLRCSSPPGISVTLDRIEFPETQVNWVWFVGSVDAATEQAVLRFFQTDAGKRALLSSPDGREVVEFKLASTLLRLSDSIRSGNESGPPPETDLSPIPPPDTQARTFNLRIHEGPRLSHPVHVTARRPKGWLQIPGRSLEQVLCLDLEGRTPADTGLLGASLIDSDNTPRGRVVAIVGAGTVLAWPLSEDAIRSGAE